jgi:kynurenine formamidase
VNNIIGEKRNQQRNELSRGTTCINLSHTFEDGLITYRGLPAPIICDFLSRGESKKHYTEGTEFHIGKIEMTFQIVEHLCGLAHLPDSGFRFFSVPAKVYAMGTFPVQAFAIVN